MAVYTRTFTGSKGSRIYYVINILRTSLHAYVHNTLALDFATIYARNDALEEWAATRRRPRHGVSSGDPRFPTRKKPDCGSFRVPPASPVATRRFSAPSRSGVPFRSLLPVAPPLLLRVPFRATEYRLRVARRGGGGEIKRPKSSGVGRPPSVLKKKKTSIHVTCRTRTAEKAQRLSGIGRTVLAVPT